MRKVFRITLYIVGGLLLLVILLVAAVNNPWGQNIIRGKAEAFLQKKINTEVKIGFLGLGFPKYIVINDILLKDQSNDTLLALHTLKIDIAMMALLKKEVDVQQIVVDGLHSHIYRNLTDTAFNFSYIVAAFASKPKKEPDTTNTKEPKEPFKIKLDRVKITDLHVNLDDATDGTTLALNLNTLTVDLKTMNLDSLFFHVREIKLAGLQTTYRVDSSHLPITPKKTTSKAAFRLVTDHVALENVQFNYDDNISRLLFAINLGALDLELKNFDLASNVVDIQKLSVLNTDASLTFGKKSKAPAIVDSIVKIDSVEGWKVLAGNVLLQHINFTMNDENAPKLTKGIDYAHLKVSDVFMDLNNLTYRKEKITGSLKHLAAKEQSGVDLQELKTAFVYDSHGATLNDLYLQTPNTVIREHLEVHYTSLASLKTNAGAMQLKLDINKSRIGFKDLLLFVPELRKQEIFARYPTSAIRCDAQCTGTLNNLYLKRLYVLTMNSTELDVKGRISGLPDVNKLQYNLNIAQLTSGREAVKDFIADSLLKAVRLPDRFTIAGNVAGNLKDYNTDLNLTSTDGSAYVKGYLKMSPGKGREVYNMLVQTNQLQVGRILHKDTLLGAVTAAISAQGRGFDPKKMTASVNGAIGSAYIKDYRYHDITFSGNTAHAHALMAMKADDPNLRMQLKGTADFSGKYPAVTAVIQLDSIDLHAIKLYDSELRARGVITADFAELNPDYPKGTFSWTQPVVTVSGKRYFLDSLYVSSAPKNGVQDIRVNLDVLQATITGRTPLTKIGAIIQDKVKKQDAFKTRPDSLLNSGMVKAEIQDTTTLPTDYYLSLKATVTDRPVLRSFVPDLTSLDSITINGALTPKVLELSVTVPEVVYGTNSLYNGRINVVGTDSGFAYEVIVDKLGNPKMSLWYAHVHGSLAQNRITATISTSDSSKKERFALGAVMITDSLHQTIQLQPGLKLNYDTWNVSAGNSIVLGKEGFYITNFNISGDGQSITANSESPTPKAPLKIDIQNFNLANVASIISSGDTALVGGILGGTVRLEQGKTATIDGDLTIKSLSFMGKPVGDLHAKAHNKTANTIDADVALTGNGNDIKVIGQYFQQPQSGNDLNMQVNINALALQSVEGLTMGQIKNSSGYIRGKLDVKGKINHPLVEGSLKTDNLKTTISTLNSMFKCPSEEIKFADNVVTFNKFNIVDSPDNRAVLDGTVNITDLTAPRFDLNLKAKNWRAVHSTAKDNKTFYGDLYLTTNMDVRGTITAPVVDGSLNILKGTNLTVITPEKTPQLESRKGIVAFINLKDTTRKNILRPRQRDSTKRVVSAGSDINVNVTVDKAAQFSLVIDQASGDFISVRGTASLNASVSKSGVIGLTGNYELTDGAYQLNYNFIKRKFLIKQGSTITFAGDPVKGTNMDVTAIYQQNIPPYELVQRQVTDEAQLNYYKQRIPFDILLHLKGQVLQPAISFDIDLPENKVYPLSSDQLELVKNRLTQVRTDTSELNKQVFAVLILNRFVADDPFNNQAGQSVSTTALQSVSTFIGEQLNQAASKLVKGVDLSVDLATTEDYTTGDMRQRTDLSLAASKRLLDDRLKLTIGNNFELEGPQATNQEANYIPSNLAADYLLSQDGRYTLRGYRRGYNKGVLEGYVTETGLNFIVNVDYNRFSSLYKQRKKRAANDSTTLKSNPKAIKK